MNFHKHPANYASPSSDDTAYSGFAEASVPHINRGVDELANVWLIFQHEVASGRHTSLNANQLAAWTNRFSAEELDELLIPKRTLVRRRANQENLSPDEMDKALRLARISTEADRVFGDEETASRWLRQPLNSYAGQTPLELLKTETGALIVAEVLMQIDHGIFA